MFSLFRKQPSQDEPRPRGRWARRFLILALGFAGLVGCAPTLVSKTPLLNLGLKRALGAFALKVHVGKASLGWFSPPVLENIEAIGTDGQPLLEVARAEGDRTLLALLLDHRDIGEIRLEQLTLHVICTGHTTNLEQALSNFVEPPIPVPEHPLGTPAKFPTLSLKLIQGKVLVRDVDNKRDWAIDSLQANCRLTHGETPDIEAVLDGVVSGGEQAGNLHGQMTWHGTEGNAFAMTRVEGRVEVANLGMPLLAPLLRRIDPNVEIAGNLTANLNATWDPAANAVDVTGNASGTSVVLAATWLGPDRLPLEKMEAGCDLTLKDRQLTIREVKAVSDIGQARLAGTLDLAQGPLALLHQSGYQISADVDLARLAVLLPGVVRLRDDTKVTSGQMNLRVASEAESHAVRWIGNLKTADLKGVQQGRPIAWQDPVALDFVIVQPENAPFPLVEKWHAEAGFVTMDVTGSAESVTASATFDLDRLAKQLGQFVDFGTLRPTGQGSSKVTWQAGAKNSFHFVGHTQLRQWRMPALNGRLWQEDDLNFNIDASGTNEGKNTRVANAAGTLRLGQDNAEFKLLEPIADLQADFGGAIQLRVIGDLARWQGRLKPWTSALDAFQMAGQGEITMRAKLTADVVTLEDVQLVAREMRFLGYGLAVQEPTLTMRTAGKLAMKPVALDLQRTEVVCPSLTLDSGGMKMAFNAAGDPEIRGTATVQGELAQVRRWYSAPGGPENLRGRLGGQVTILPANGKLALQTDLTLTDFIYGNPAAPTWREPKVQVVGKVHYDNPADALRFEQLRVTTAALAADASGQVAKLSGSMDIAVTGTLQYDLHRLEPTLKSFLGESARIEGQDARPFRLEGSLAGPTPIAAQVGQPAPPAPSMLANLLGNAGFGWKSAQAYGCTLGPAEVKIALIKGWFRVDPIEATLNGGRLHMAPYGRLEPGPMELYLPKGTGVDRFQLTKATCASALGYALPALADAVEADGQISLQIEAGRVPLANPAASDIDGRLIIHNSRIATGPLIQELATLLKSPSTATLGQEAVVPVRLVNGRVYHRDLQLIFPDLTIRTQGSVGLDGTLDLLAELPIPPKWLGGKSLSQVLAKQTIRLPVRGTVSKPKIDQRALEAALAQVLRDSAGDVLRQELDKKLNKFLAPKK